MKESEENSNVRIGTIASGKVFQRDWDLEPLVAWLGKVLFKQGLVRRMGTLYLG